MRQSRTPLDLLFVGGVFTPDEEQRVLGRSRGVVQFAANALQWHLVRGLDVANGAPVTLLNAPFVGSFPRLHRDVWIGGSRWSHAAGARDETTGFLNVFGVKHVWRAVALASRARQWARSGDQKLKAMVVYSMHAPFVFAAAMARRVNPEVRVCLVVPDLPEFMNPSGEGVGALLRLAKWVDRRLLDRCLRSVTHFALLTRHMAGPAGVGGRPWIVMEGAVDPGEQQACGQGESPRELSPKAILYTGSLDKAYGIGHLLEAFSLIPDPGYELWICGAGGAEKDVRAASTRDGRVRYLGQVPRTEALELQRQATVLVNPRGGEGEYTKYSFPSKTMEYMLSGTPVVARGLPGIPEEYLEYVAVVDGASAADLARRLVEVCSMPMDARQRMGERARTFVIDNKSATAQATRILDLLTAAG